MPCNNSSEHHTRNMAANVSCHWPSLATEQTATGANNRLKRMKLSTSLFFTVVVVIILSTLSIDANQLQQQQPPSNNDSNQREVLKRSLNEILVQFLHETGKQNNNNNQQQQQRSQPHSQQQQQQLQQRASSKEISCDELSLVVLAQRVLKMNASTSAISRLIECQHLENNHLSGQAARQQHDNSLLLDNNNTNYVNKFSTSNNNDKSNADRLSSVVSAAQQQNVAATPVISEIEPQFISVHRRSSLLNELHFGAKLALTLLMATIALVAFATFIDIYSSTETSRGIKKSKKLVVSKSTQQSRPTSASISNQHQANQLRQHRSPSLSSSCSSSLFCSSNSVASSSAPILARNNNNSNHHHHHHNNRYNTTKKYHYELNVTQQSHSHLNNYNDNSLKSSLNNDHPQQHTNSIDDNQHHHSFSNSIVDIKLHEQQQHDNTTNNNSCCWSAAAMETTDDMAQNDSEKNQPQSSQADFDNNNSELKDFNSLQLIKQIVLAFSLRQSVRQIIGSDDSVAIKRRASKKKQEFESEIEHDGQQIVTGHLGYVENNVAAQMCSRNGVPSERVAHWQSNAHVVQRRTKMAPTANSQAEPHANNANQGENETTQCKNLIDLQQQHHHHQSVKNNHFIRFHNDNNCPDQEFQLSSKNGCPRRYGDCQQQTTITNVEQQQEANSADHHESIDSLHGLRFLSMIWVIVIHSYNFALRWMYFTNTNTVEGIYKTIASQLLANGSFACDSFFFAAGFLLPYLALAPQHTNNATPNQEVTVDNNNMKEEKLSTVTRSSSHHDEDGDDHHRLQRGETHHQSENNEDERINITNSTCSPFEFNRSFSPTSVLEGGLVGLESEALNARCYSCRSTLEAKATAITTERTVNPATGTASHAPHDQCFYFTCCAKNTNEQQRQQGNNNHRDRQTTRDTNRKQQRVAAQNHDQQETTKISLSFYQVLMNIFHRYVRMMPLMMAIIGLSATLLRYIGDGPAWDDSTMMYDQWCRKNWWVNLLFLHNFVNRENMCLSHSWYSAVDLQLFLVGQLLMYILFKSRRIGLTLLFAFLFGSQLITATLTLLHHLPAVPLIASVSEQAMNLYYGEIYIKPYCRASPYLIGILLAYLMRTTSLGQLKLKKWQVALGWIISLSLFATILFIMQPAMNGHTPSELQSAAYSALSRPLWACATGWMIFACITKQGGPIGSLLSARCFVPFSRLTYPAFLIHPIVMAIFYGSRQSSFHFSHYLMLYLILGNIVITYASAFILAALFELPLLSIERIVKRRFF